MAKQLIVGTNDVLHREFKLAVTSNGGNMAAVIRKMMEEYVKKNKAKKGAK